MRQYIENAYTNNGIEFTVFQHNGEYEAWREYGEPDAELIAKGSYDKCHQAVTKSIIAIEESLIG